MTVTHMPRKKIKIRTELYPYLRSTKRLRLYFVLSSPRKSHQLHSGQIRKIEEEEALKVVRHYITGGNIKKMYKKV